MLNTNKNRTVQGIVQELLRHLSQVSLVTRVSEEFSVLRTNSERVNFVYKLLEDAELFPALIVDEKSNGKSENLRQKGNDLFKNKDNKTALELYTKSIAYAQDNSECLALAYANRSAILFDGGFYQECLKDIHKALQNKYPDNLKQKILARQEKAMRLSENQNSFIYYQSVPKIPQDRNNTSIQCSADSVRINYTEDLGRHIVAAKDIDIGEVIAVEKPFCHILIAENYSHCYECLELCYNLLPCPNCTQAMYCSEECMRKGYIYHKFECPLIATLKILNMDKLKLLPMKIAMTVKDQYLKLTDNFNLDLSNVYRSDNYKEIHNLVANTENRTASDLFERSVVSAVIFHLVKTYTHFFDNDVEETIFKELVLLHLQTAACNFHEISELAANKDSVYELEEIGAGAYSFMSLFNHSCSPNVVRHCHGPVIVLRAIQSIKMGEQCYDNYGYHHALMNRNDRRTKLKKQYFFDCICQVCKEDWPLYQDLPEINTNFEISSEDLLALQKGDVDIAKRVLTEIMPKSKELENVKPNKNFAELQEIMKQCFALLGNVRRTL